MWDGRDALCDDHRRIFIERRRCAEDGQQAYTVKGCSQHSVLRLAVPIRKAVTRDSLREIHKVLMPYGMSKQFVFTSSDPRALNSVQLNCLLLVYKCRLR